MAVLRSEGSLLHASHRPSSQPGTPAARGSDLPQLHQHACSINGHAANRPAGLDEQLRALAARRLNALADDGSGFLALACFFGLLLGLAMPVDGAMPAPWDRVGEVAGWMYVMAWGAALYPQLLGNWRRRSVVGLSLDLALLNPAGSLCLLAYYGCFAFSPSVRADYRARYGTDSAVRLNDVFFAAHASCITLATLAQCAVYDRGSQRVHARTRTAFAVMVPVTAVYAAAVCLAPEAFPVLWFLYYLSYVKVAVAMAMYLPQVLLNHERRSTAGFSIEQVLCDFAGGILSLFQLCLEATVMRDFSLITGDPVKAGLGLVSLFYDVVLLAQHYVLYPAAHSAGMPRLGSQSAAKLQTFKAKGSGFA